MNSSPIASIQLHESRRRWFMDLKCKAIWTHLFNVVKDNSKQCDSL
ncbi:unnamed protein product [Arabidopsis halleri]